MNKTKALQNLLNRVASEEEIELLKQLLVSGEISIGGNVTKSVIILGSGNTVEITPETLDRLGARPLLGNLERDLNGEEIALGLQRLESELPFRAPVLISQLQEQARKLLPIIKPNPNALSESARMERLEALARVNSLCMEALDISFSAVATGEAVPGYEARSPFRGLESFRVDDCEFFFGREELTKKLVEKVKTHSFLAVLGASGSGKSSLVMAGVIPALNLDYAIIRPGTNPLQALESVHGKSLLVVDQFEELFTLTRDEKTRADFISVLLKLRRSVKVIITLRSDFLGEAGAYRSLSAEIQNDLEIIPPMNADELRRAMEGQARWARLEFEADLSQQILDDVAGEPGAMPLLQHALWELWNRRHGRHLRANEYRAFGGVKQAITSTAEKVYMECSKPEQEQVRDIFLRLTRVDDSDEGRDTRRRIPLGDLIPSGADAASISVLLDKLAKARLIVKTVNDDVTEIEVAHEALIRHWERLRAWLNEDRDALRLRESVSESAKEWEKSGKHESLLNSRWVKLDEALLLSEDSRYRLTEVEQLYLKGCVALRNREQRERERRLRYTVFASIAAAIIFLALGGFAVYQMLQSQKEAKTARAGELAVLALSESNGQFDRALLLDVESLTLERNYQTLNSMSTLLQARPDIIKFLQGHSSFVTSITFSPTGNLLASGSCGTWDFAFMDTSCEEGELILWDTSNPNEAKQTVKLIDDYSGISDIVFTPDGKVLAAADWNGHVILWDLTYPHQPAKLSEFVKFYAWITDMAMSPDGKTLAIIQDYVTVLFDISTPSAPMEIATLINPESKNLIPSGTKALAFVPSGDNLLFVNDDGTVVVWDVASQASPAQISNQQIGSFSSVAISQDGRFLAAGSDDQSVTLWDISNPLVFKMLKRLDAHKGSVTSVAFSPDGKTLISGGTDGKVIIWDVTDPASVKEIEERSGHTNSVLSLVFSPDGKFIASGDYNKTIILWNNASGFSPIQHVQPAAHGDSIRSLAYRRDGKLLASGSGDTSIKLWDVSNLMKANLITTISENTGSITSLAFSPDGNLLAAGDSDFNVTLWDTSKPEHPNKHSVISGHKNIVRDVAFSPDGKILLSSGGANVSLWDISNPGSPSEIASVEAFDSRMVISPNGKLLVVGAYAAGLWDISNPTTPKEVAILSGHDRASLAFSPNNELLASGGCRYYLNSCMQGEVVLWDISDPASPVQKAVLLVGTSQVTNLTFSRDGKSLVSVVGDRIVIWDVSNPASPAQQITLALNTENIQSIAYSPDGNSLMSGDLKGTLISWNLDPDTKSNPNAWINVACELAGRNFIRAEWAQYFPNEKYRKTCDRWPIEPEVTATSVP